MPLRVRHSIEYLQTLYDTNEDKSMLDKVIKAFIGIQALPAEHENSFWKLQHTMGSRTTITATMRLSSSQRGTGLTSSG